MFWTIPSSQGEIITNSPLSVKSIRYLFFENKNGGLFLYSQSPDNITISIDGKVVCRDMFMLPFCTSSPDTLNRFDWNDVALEINMNAYNAEVRISGLRTNDFNIVFVCSDKEVNEAGGFDFFETKFFALKRTEIPAQNRVHVLRPNISSILGNLVVTRPTAIKTATSDKEMVVQFDYAPKFVFCYPYISDINGKIKNHRLAANFDISCGENELIPDRTDLSIITANERIGFRKALYSMPEQIKKDLKLTIRLADAAGLANSATILNADAVFCFGYKKIN